MENTKEYGNIYYLKNPLTKDLIYIGCTVLTLEERLKKHYWDVNAYLKGNRGANKRLVYLHSLLPTKCTIHLIEKVEVKDLEDKEIYYIKKYSRKFKLLNITKGGKGGDIYTNQTEERKLKISEKISIANKGKAKPKGFAEHLSLSRRGKNNPNCREISIGWFVADSTHLFKYSFEVNQFIYNKYIKNGLEKKETYSNIYRKLKLNGNCNAYGYAWELFSNVSKEIQDIVHSDYESNQEN